MKAIIQKQIKFYNDLGKQLVEKIKDGTEEDIDGSKVVIGTLLLVINDLKNCIAEYDKELENK